MEEVHKYIEIPGALAWGGGKGIYVDVEDLTWLYHVIDIS